MESDVKGAPTADGYYIILTRNGERSVQRRNGRYYFGVSSCDSQWTDTEILAHRKHEPLVVPELKELVKYQGKPRVVKFGGEVCYAEHLPLLGHSGWIVIVHAKSGVYWTSKGTAPDITKEQCEAEGYRYPEECK